MDDSNQQSENQNISLEQLQTDLDNAMNNWKRALADFENYKKQKERENKELLEFAKEVTVVKLLPTLDALGQALKHLPEFSDHSDVNSEHLDRSFAQLYKNWQEGVNGIVMQLDQTLGELGVKKIEAVGKKFDPHLHEAVKEVEGDEDSVVVEELQAGFELSGKVIRPSQVVISKQKN